MKTLREIRNELARKHADEYKDLGVAVYESSEYDFTAGFDAGFAEAVKMLRSEEAYNHSEPKLVTTEDGTSVDMEIIGPSAMADWLESKINEEKIYFKSAGPLNGFAKEPIEDVEIKK